MSPDLSTAAKRTFQVVALIATLFVVGIHYQSASTDYVVSGHINTNQWAQEFLFDGLARVAVPLFALSAGLFYYRSDDGTFACYRKKLKSRAVTILVPYLIVCSVSMASLVIVDRLEDRGSARSVSEFFEQWLLHPPAEQLWFLRDLMVLVIAAPLIRWLTTGHARQAVTLSVLAGAWCTNWQPFPIVANWHLLHIETLLFFVIGRSLCGHFRVIERIGRSPASLGGAMCMAWFGLVMVRIVLRPDFDVWYVDEFGVADILVQRMSILVGCVALFMTAWRMRHPILLRYSGASFFIYLAHEFPLRAVAERFSDRFLDYGTSCWILTPSVVAICLAMAFVLSERIPRLFAIITGGRMPCHPAPRQMRSAREPLRGEHLIPSSRVTSHCPSANS